MKARSIAAATAALLSLGLGAPALAGSDPHSHGHDAPVVAAADPHSQAHAAQSHALSLDHGRKWATDAALRKGMGEIRAALAAKRHAIQEGALGASDARALAGTLESQVAFIVAECKLEPAADANLHIVVADLVASVDAMKSAPSAAAAQGARRAVEAANAYGRYFDHPGWQPL